MCTLPFPASGHTNLKTDNALRTHAQFSRGQYKTGSVFLLHRFSLIGMLDRLVSPFFYVRDGAAMMMIDLLGRRAPVSTFAVLTAFLAVAIVCGCNGYVGLGLVKGSQVSQVRYLVGT